ITWSGDGAIGRISINAEYWAAVEWSERRQAWCIEDAEGRCLAHKENGQAISKEAAVTLAREMILDGRMPSPQQAHDARLATQRERARRREKRNQQPAQIRKREKRRRMNKAQNAAFRAQWEAERLDKAQLPIEEALAVVFDFTDPELWKSNSWAVLRPRLIMH